MKNPIKLIKESKVKEAKELSQKENITFKQALNKISNRKTMLIQKPSKDVFDFTKFGYNPNMVYRTQVMGSTKEGSTEPIIKQPNDIFDFVKGGYDESMVYTTQVIDSAQKKADEFDKKPELISGVPNSYLIFGGLAILIYSIVK